MACRPVHFVMLCDRDLRTRKCQSSFAIIALFLLLLTQCGGQTELSAIEPTSGGTSTSTGGTTGGSGFTTTGGTSVITQSDSGVPCQLPANDLDYSCTVDSDCVAVPGGDPCMPNCAAACLSATVNSRVAAKYLSDFDIPTSGNWRSLACRGCPPCVVGPCCRQGVCKIGCDVCN